MRRWSPVLAALLVGCGTTDEPLPTACQGDAAEYARALRAAPDLVRLNRTTTLAECVRRSTSDAELISLGTRLTTVGEELEVRGMRGERRAALQLGYLIGATQRAARDTPGIHTELAYRLERSGAALVGAPNGAERALQRGIAAGAARG